MANGVPSVDRIIAVVERYGCLLRFSSLSSILGFGHPSDSSSSPVSLSDDHGLLSKTCLRDRLGFEKFMRS